ncbi:hypothetical protein ACR6C2_42545 [Streptomyces sp. INA 01156]
MEPELPTVNVRLWHADAVVLFDWSMSTDLDAVPITHPTQKQALVDLLGRLESDVDAGIASSTSEEARFSYCYGRRTSSGPSSQRGRRPQPCAWGIAGRG